ncbi:MAG TPA: VOC family protein [Candidatus Dormibacteraeota bacterium]
MHLKVGNVAFDCNDVLKVAAFWSAAIGRPLDPESGTEFASIGGSDPERIETAWYFNKVPEAKTAKNRVHLDLITPDAAAVAQLVALGATFVARHEIASRTHSWSVMQDPEGNEFCVAAKPFTGWS